MIPNLSPVWPKDLKTEPWTNLALIPACRQCLQAWQSWRRGPTVQSAVHSKEAAAAGQRQDLMSMVAHSARGIPSLSQIAMKVRPYAPRRYYLPLPPPRAGPTEACESGRADAAWSTEEIR